MASLDDVRAVYDVSLAHDFGEYASYAVVGPDFTVYVRWPAQDRDDEAALSSLVDPGAVAARAYAVSHPEVHDAAASLRALGYAVSQPDMAADAFDVDGGSTHLTGQTSGDLVSLAGSLSSVVPPPVQDRAAELVAVLADDPNLAQATRDTLARLRDALA